MERVGILDVDVEKWSKREIAKGYIALEMRR
jgi:hypothetical protein